MPSCASLKRSSPLILQIPAIRRTDLRPFSTSPPPEPSLSSSNQSHDYSTWKKKSTDSVSGSVLRSLSGILVGSSFGYWLFSSSPDSSFSFADWTTLAAFGKEDLQENRIFHRFLSPPAPEWRTKYLFPDEFRRRVFFNYEKRIRLRSPPKKIFEYFSSFESPEGELFMTPADLMRAVVPVFPPSESNIVREGNLRGERRPPGELHCPDSELFKLFDTNNDGRISFPEYIFFVTLLSLPESSFSIAFKMFDLDNSGEIRRDEFKQVMNLMRSCNRQGASHRDGLRFGLKVGNSVENGGLLEHFFGKDGNESLQHAKFVDFLEKLHAEILRLEFAHYDYKLRDTISAKDFALSMVASADMNHINQFLDQVDELENVPHLRDMRIEFKEFKAFAELRKKLQPLALALFSYGKVRGLLTKKDLQRAARHVCGVSISDNVVDVIFHVFDLNRDGNLSTEEFLGVLQRREKDIAYPTGTGVAGLICCWWNCAKSSSLTKLFH